MSRILLVAWVFINLWGPTLLRFFLNAVRYDTRHDSRSSNQSNEYLASLCFSSLVEELVQVNLSLEPPPASVITESVTLAVESNFAICAAVVDMVLLLFSA